MSCSCRAAPWSIFVRGLAQIHNVEAVSGHARAARFPSQVAQARSQQLLTAWRQHRGFQSTRQLGQDAVAAKTPPLEEARAEMKDADQTEDSADRGPDKADELLSADRTRSSRKKENRQFAEKTDPGKTEAQPGDLAKRKRGRKPGSRPGKDDAATAAAQADTDTSNHTKSREGWQSQKESLKTKFPEGWRPRKRLSPDALAGIRALNAQFPDVYTTQALADKFEVSSEAIRRILKSKWQPSVDEEQDRQDRWFRRGKQVWERKAALGVKPPKRWREEGIARDPGYHEWSRRASRREREWEEEEVRRYREARERERAERSRGGSRGRR